MPDPQVLVLGDQIDLYALGYIDKLSKITEQKSFQRDKIIINSIKIPLINIDDQFCESNPKSMFSNINWRYQSVKRKDKDGNLIWDGVIDDFEDNQQGKVCGLISKNSLLKFFNTRIAYTSSNWETPGDAFKNICDAYDFTDYNSKYVNDSIARYTANNCYIKCVFELDDNITFQQAIEKISKYGAADCYSANNNLCFKLWQPFTGGVKFYLTDSDLSKPVRSKLSRVYYNDYRISYYQDSGVPATDSANNNIGNVSRDKNNDQSLPYINGRENQQIMIKDLTSAVWLGEQHIKRTHINLSSIPFALKIITFSIPYNHKDFIDLQTYFRLTCIAKGWTNKLFEVFKSEKDEANQIINIEAYEVAENG